MKFCPKCEIKLKKNDASLQCPKCGHIEGGEEQQPKSEKKEFNSEFAVFAENEGNETQPTVSIECEKCGNDQAIWWMLQTRSADEPTTQFYRCTKCRYTWRDYT